MSIENVKNFYAKVNEDENLQQRLKELAKVSAEESIEALIRLAEAQGLPFDQNELKEFFSEAAKNYKSQGELNDEDLDAVAGGGRDEWIFASVITAGIGCAFSLLGRPANDCIMDRPWDIFNS